MGITVKAEWFMPSTRTSPRTKYKTEDISTNHYPLNSPDTGNTFDAYKAKALQAATPSTPPVGTLPVGGLRKLHIDVGFNGELMFNPNNVTELIGTVVEFSYNPAVRNFARIF